LSKKDLIKEIKKRRPWFQRIEFPGYGITTTDDLDDVAFDGANDNLIDGLNKNQACILRPIPKWKYIKNFLPDISGLEILEVGCNSGFFCFKFAELGAKKVIGVDIKKKWYEQAVWVNSILGFKQVSFFNCDFFILNNPFDNSPKIINNEISAIPLPQNNFDLIFSSTVINHMFFPFLAIYKMLVMSRNYVVIDLKVPINKEQLNMTLYVRPSGKIHSFKFSENLLVKMINRMGIDLNDIQIYKYNDNKSMTMVVKTANYSGSVFRIDDGMPEVSSARIDQFL
jgi:SAM-dependent methyltransferase